MQTPSQDSIKATEGKFHLVRKSAYNGGCTEKVTWQVCEKVAHNIWKLHKEYSRKYDAMYGLFIYAKV